MNSAMGQIPCSTERISCLHMNLSTLAHVLLSAMIVFSVECATVQLHLCVSGRLCCVQLTGEATLLNYAPMIFHQVGFHSNTAAVLATLGLGVVKVTQRHLTHG